MSSDITKCGKTSADKCILADTCRRNLAPASTRGGQCYAAFAPVLKKGDVCEGYWPLHERGMRKTEAANAP